VIICGSDNGLKREMKKEIRSEKCNGGNEEGAEGVGGSNIGKFLRNNYGAITFF
jgi:hypothetical protein